MNRWSRSIRTTLLLAALVAAGRLSAQASGIAVGTMAPATVMVESLDGKAMDLAAFYGKGKPVVLEFWATWCPLCRELEPAMQAARAKHAEQVTFVSVGISSNQSAARQKAHAEANKMGGEFVFDAQDAAQKSFSVPHTSYVVVLDAKGKVVYTGQGGTQDIEAALKKALP